MELKQYQQTSYNVQLKQQQKIHEMPNQQLASERVTEQIEDDITSLRNKLNQTPLSFYVKLSQSYLLSFNKQQLAAHILKTILLSIFQIAIGVFVNNILKISDIMKNCMIGLIALNLTLFLLLFIVDPGTLFEDQQEQLESDRFFCQPCRLYRYQSTHHCHWCIKCVKGYDHHCSFFGKCIGQRNYLMFVGFILSMGAGGIISMGGLIYSIFMGI